MSIRCASSSAAGSGAAGSTSITDGRPGPQTQAVYSATSWFGSRPRRTYTPSVPSSLTASKYQLSFHSGSGPGSWRPSSAGSGFSGGGLPAPGAGSSSTDVEIDRLLRRALHRGHEHVVAAVGPLDDHRGADRHHEVVEHLAAVLLPAGVPAERP